MRMVAPRARRDDGDRVVIIAVSRSDTPNSAEGSAIPLERLYSIPYGDENGVCFWVCGSVERGVDPHGCQERPIGQLYDDEGARL